jgi:phage shock protein A
MPIRLFGKKKEAPKADDPVARSEELGRQIMDLDLRVQQLDKVISSEKAQGKAAMQAKNKAKAVRHVKRVKVIEKQQQHVYKLIENYQVQQDKIQEAVTNIEYITQAKKNQQAIEQMFAAHGLSPDAAEEIIDEVQDQFARLDEFTAALDRDIGSPADEDELSDELAQWQAELDAEDDSAVAAPAAPARATAGRVPVAAAEDDEMAALMGAFS